MISCGEFAAHLRLSARRTELVLSEVIATVVASGVVRAKSYIGHDQSDWPSLSDATLEGFRHISGVWIEGKIDLGYSPPDQPLLREGNLRESIEGEVDGLIGTVGSTSKVGLWQELGTEGAEYPIPPRPFLSKALLEQVPEIEALCEEAAVKLLVPGRG